MTFYRFNFDFCCQESGVANKVSTCAFKITHSFLRLLCFYANRCPAYWISSPA